jgi:hypothetical protein
LRKAGFRPVEECGPDEEHTVPWLLMLFDPGGGAYRERPGTTT